MAFSIYPPHLIFKYLWKKRETKPRHPRASARGRQAFHSSYIDEAMPRRWYYFGVKRRYPYERRYDKPLQITRDDTQSLLVSTERAIRTGELVGATRGDIFPHSGAGRRGRPPDHLYKRGEDQMRIDADSKRKKKKKREQSVMEAEMFRFIEKTM